MTDALIDREFARKLTDRVADIESYYDGFLRESRESFFEALDAHDADLTRVDSLPAHVFVAMNMANMASGLLRVLPDEQRSDVDERLGTVRPMPEWLQTFVLGVARQSHNDLRLASYPFMPVVDGRPFADSELHGTNFEALAWFVTALVDASDTLSSTDATGDRQQDIGHIRDLIKGMLRKAANLRHMYFGLELGAKLHDHFDPPDGHIAGKAGQAAQGDFIQTLGIRAVALAFRVYWEACSDARPAPTKKFWEELCHCSRRFLPQGRAFDRGTTAWAQWSTGALRADDERKEQYLLGDAIQLAYTLYQYVELVRLWQQAHGDGLVGSDIPFDISDIEERFEKAIEIGLAMGEHVDRLNMACRLSVITARKGGADSEAGGEYVWDYALPLYIKLQTELAATLLGRAAEASSPQSGSVRMRAIAHISLASDAAGMLLVGSVSFDVDRAVYNGPLSLSHIGEGAEPHDDQRRFAAARDVVYTGQAQDALSYLAFVALRFELIEPPPAPPLSPSVDRSGSIAGRDAIGEFASAFAGLVRSTLQTIRSDETEESSAESLPGLLNAPPAAATFDLLNLVELACLFVSYSTAIRNTAKGPLVRPDATTVFKDLSAALPFVAAVSRRRDTVSQAAVSDFITLWHDAQGPARMLDDVDPSALWRSRCWGVQKDDGEPRPLADLFQVSPTASSPVGRVTVEHDSQHWFEFLNWIRNGCEAPA